MLATRQCMHTELICTGKDGETLGTDRKSVPDANTAMHVRYRELKKWTGVSVCNRQLNTWSG